MRATRTHIPADDGPLCRNGSITATVGTADCNRCCRLMDELLGVLLDVARGTAGTQKRAAALANRLGYSLD